MYRGIARSSTIALRASYRPVFVPIRFASSSSKDSGSSWEGAKKEASNVVDNIKQAGKEWAKDVSRTPGDVNHPYVSRSGAEPTAAQKAKSSLNDMTTGWAKEKVGEVKEAAQEGAQALKEKAKEGAEFVKDKINQEGSLADKAKEGAQFVKEKAQEGLEKGKEAAQDLKGKAVAAEANAEQAAGGVIDKAQEIAQKTYEMVAPAVTSAFAAAKPMAEKAYTEYVKPAATAAFEFVKEKSKEGVEFVKEKGSEMASAAPSAADAKEYVKEKGSELLEKGKEAISEGKEAVSQTKEAWDKTKQEALKEGKEALNTVKQEAKKITPKDNDQPISGSIPGQQRKIDVEGDKPFSEAGAKQWEKASESEFDTAYRQGRPSSTERNF